MVWAEIILIVIGIVMIGVSFYVTERLSDQDLEQISMMSKNDLSRISELQVKEMQNKLEHSLEDIIDESLVITRRGLERETNNKIMAVSEYSETVLDNINKSHNEVMFLYSNLGATLPAVPYGLMDHPQQQLMIRSAMIRIQIQLLLLSNTPQRQLLFIKYPP